VTSEPAQETLAWRPLDSLLLASVTVIAAAIRWIGLKEPGGLVFDEFYYAPDACRYVHESADLCGSGELTYFHPPLAKWLISFGIQLFGPTRFGWRFPSVMIGAATIACVYLLARKLLRSTVAATVASGLLAIDFLHLVQSRVAMLDVFVTFFGVLTILCCVYDRDDPRPGAVRPWRLAAGIAAGGAIACKWSGLSFLVAAIVIVVISDRARAGTGPPRSWLRTLGSAALWLGIVPVVVYAVTYLGRLDGTLLAAPWAEHSWLREFVLRQVDSWQYQSNIKQGLAGAVHPYSSPAWTWILLKRPIAFYFVVYSNGAYSEILAMGSPLVWWASLPALAYAAWRSIRPAPRAPNPGVIVGGFAAAYLPWFVLPLGGPDPYSFYLLPAVPFMCLALGYIAAIWWPRSIQRALTIAFVTGAVALFAFFYPLLTAAQLTPDQWRTRMWFTACRFDESTTPGKELREAGLPIGADSTGVVPPRAVIPNQTRALGWCWI
jgi:dolichyl-phosphate-mannose--protein O-mannosyl transferase